jgi:hypothetical protein
MKLCHINPFKRRIKTHLPFSNIIRRFNVYGEPAKRAADSTGIYICRANHEYRWFL